MKYSNKQVQDFYKNSKQLLVNELTDKDIEYLIELLVFHEYRYYVLNDPLIADKEYDELYKKLEKLEQAYPNKISANSPTQRVSSELIENFETVTHTIPMLSLDNSYNQDDLFAFDKRVKDLSNAEEVEYVVEPKFDGSSIALVYENGQLVRGATRGNGVEGENVTQNVRTISSIPLKTTMQQKGIVKAEVRGEVVIRKDIFNKINTEREKNGDKLLANARNSAAGALRIKDSIETKKRGLDAFIYQLGYAIDTSGTDLLQTELTEHFNNINLLGDMGFKVPIKESKLCKNIHEVVSFIESWEQKRETYPYEIDGMVIKVNSREIQNKCGFTAHHPRWAIAYKFKAKQGTSKLVKVEYQVGRTGAVTPVAKIEPLNLAGVTISSISLHNADNIKDKDVRLGDKVLIERAGDVIPYIVKSLEELRDGSETKIEFPTECPICYHALHKPEDEAVWRCVNTVCPAQIEEKLVHFVAKDAMDIEGLGKDIVKRFYKKGFINKIEDLYNLPFDEIEALDGWGEKSIDRLKDGLENSKKRAPERLLYALGIRHVGLTTAKVLLAHEPLLLNLKNWGFDQLVEIKDIGPKVANSIVEFFSDEQNQILLQNLSEIGLKIEKDKVELASNSLDGKTFLFTGTLQKMGRKEAQQKVEDNGGRLISSVSKNLNYLVAGEKAGSKLKKAETIDSIQVLTEDEFLQMIG